MFKMHFVIISGTNENFNTVEILDDDDQDNRIDLTGKKTFLSVNQSNDFVCRP